MERDGPDRRASPATVGEAPLSGCYSMKMYWRTIPQVLPSGNTYHSGYWDIPTGQWQVHQSGRRRERVDSISSTSPSSYPVASALKSHTAQLSGSMSSMVLLMRHHLSSLVWYITRNGMIGIRGRCYITWVRRINYTRGDLIYPLTINTPPRQPTGVKHDPPLDSRSGTW